MNRTVWLGGTLLLVAVALPAAANPIRTRGELDRVNHRLKGQVIDHTRNHGQDRRVWSPALQEKRDLYVYLPPGFDPAQSYPLLIWLHGYAQDEKSFLYYVAEPLDRAIACGDLPPLIVAAPDGSLSGSDCLITAGGFFINTLKAGNFEDFVLRDVWDFIHTLYPIRPGREAHGIAGVSMGGGAAYNLAFKHRDRFQYVAALFPPLNARWVDCHGRYFGDFDPDCWGWRTDFGRRHEAVGRFYGFLRVPMRKVIGSIYDQKSSETTAQVSHDNPIEMLDRLNIREGDLAMYVGYGGKDQFNIDAQVESFLYAARQRGLTVQVEYDPKGKHDYATAMKFLPGLTRFLRAQLK